jgi:hypothetical protein
MPLLGRKNIEPKPPDRPFIISSVGRYQRDEKIILEVTIQGKNNKIHNTTAMVDCGATENFIDKDYAEQIKIPLDKKKIPRRVLAIDGREIASGPVTHDTSIELIINNHREKIKLHCITIGNSPIIMGLPWLKKHNPSIDWKEGRVTFNSEQCAKMCLEQSPHARTIPEESAIRQYHRELIQNTIEKENKTHKKQEDEESLNEFPTSYEEISLTDNYDDSYEDKEEVLNKDTEEFTSPIKQKPEDIVPLEYHDYLSVFQEKEKPVQPPHRHQDHRIPLMDNRIPPFEPLRALDEN